MGKTELRYRHQLNGILAIYNEGEGLHRMRKVERLMVELAGAGWLNFGYAKDAFSAALTYGASSDSPVKPPDAIVIVTAVDKYIPNAAFGALPAEEQEKLWSGKHARDMPQYFEPHDHLMALVQTPERVCIYTQRLMMPGFLLVGEPEIQYFPQSAFAGRMKFFGGEDR